VAALITTMEVPITNAKVKQRMIPSNQPVCANANGYANMPEPTAELASVNTDEVIVPLLALGAVALGPLSALRSSNG
jgi:hypothetical protein